MAICRVNQCTLVYFPKEEDELVPRGSNALFLFPFKLLFCLSFLNVRSNSFMVLLVTPIPCRCFLGMLVPMSGFALGAFKSFLPPQILLIALSNVDPNIISQINAFSHDMGSLDGAILFAGLALAAGSLMEDQTMSSSSIANPDGAPVVASKGTMVSFNHNISVKLDDKNLLLWKSQVMADLVGHGLKAYVEGKEQMPYRFKSAKDSVAGKVSKEYLAWIKHDQLIASWLISTMSDSMGTKVLDCTHSYEVMDRVIQIFGINIRARAHQFRTELRNTKKGDKNMANFLLEIKSIADSLATIGSQVPEHDLIQCILEGLPGKYESFVTSFHLKSETVSIWELEASLIAQEVRVEKNIKGVATSQASAHVASDESKDKSSSSSKSNGQNQFNNNNR
ncbi:retrovirus-related Pol polyprotein from transposon TNT 1-94 [Senna tora]|uniref:Retrovirus-related Pol polyprotein from transposon TNT 1-94 n=1 Tax=Senna tora TaxID=362788 RepID=A0A834WFQ3_9FABA|nr:retrovirus-related Pol polyprotein from transposon TNT 1-94 [Senna tora]